MRHNEVQETWIHKIGIANIVAISTLLLTLATFYYQFWRVSYSAKATIIALFPNYNGAALATDIIFTNSGNRQCSIARISLMSKSHFDDKRFEQYSNGWGHIDCAQVPFSINPNEVVSKQLLLERGRQYLSIKYLNVFKIQTA